MQEKIEEVLRKHLRIEASGKALDALQVMQLTVAVMGKKEAAAEIVALIEREVIWEDEGTLRQDYEDRSQGAVVKLWSEQHQCFVRFEVGDTDGYFGKDAQRARVIVEGIDDKKSAD